MDYIPVLSLSQVVGTSVLQKIRKEVELRNELLKICRAAVQRLEAICDAVEESIGCVKLLTLKLVVLCRERVDANQIITDDSPIRVEAAEQEIRDAQI